MYATFLAEYKEKLTISKNMFRNHRPENSLPSGSIIPAMATIFSQMSDYGPLENMLEKLFPKSFVSIDEFKIICGLQDCSLYNSAV